MSDHQMPRRSFLKTAAVGAAGAAFGMPTVARAAFPSGVASPARADALKLGVASYSLRKFSRPQAIEMIQALRAPYVAIKSFHLPYELSPAELRAGARDFEQAGLTIVGGGTITFDENTDEGVRKYFEYAKHAGIPVMVSTTRPAFAPQEILPRIEKFAKQYDIKVAIHNHGPEDKVYPSVRDALKYMRNMDPRMGVCLDIGHESRTGNDIVESIKLAGPRLFDMHIKDLSDPMDRDSQVIVGEGVLPIAEIFRTLLAMNYQGTANLEYEIDADNPLPGMEQSFAHMRGVLAGLAAGRTT